MTDFQKLSQEFPRDAVHWRAQTLTRDGSKALALAYLDARDVMDRLDDVCGPENWQSEITETPKGRVICRLGILINDKWVWKTDGAGHTAVEGEKGGISDALKRAAVHWGIGRYLYRMDAVWAPCDTYEKNGKKFWSSWKSSPWNFVGNSKLANEPPKNESKTQQLDPAKTRDRIKAAIAKIGDAATLKKFWDQPTTREAFGKLHPAMQGELQKAYTDRMAAVFQAPRPGE